MRIIKSIYDFTKKTVTIEEIKEYFKLEDYHKLVEFINVVIEEGNIEAVKSSKTNGMRPYLYNKYRILFQSHDYSDIIEEINYNFPHYFQRDYYINNPKKYIEDKIYIEKLIHYFRHNKEKFQISMSINERSFDIWGEEKYLKEGSGRTILKNLGMDLDKLNIYFAPEPFVYYSINRHSGQKVLIIENKDTWYTLRRLMMEGQSSFLGEEITTIIYGCGKNIEKSLEEYQYTVEDYLLEPEKMLYWGDLDYEGIGIFERLKERYIDRFNIEIFKEAYIKMIELAEGRSLSGFKEKQNKNIKDIFLEVMGLYSSKILYIFTDSKYIPQEIINYGVLKG